MRTTLLLATTIAVLVSLAGGVALAAVINCPNAARGYCYGTKVGDGMYGSARVDRMFGFGGADLMYGYGRGDSINGGGEVGWGDKILGGNGADDISGQRGDDGLYGGNGNDAVYGGPGDDIVQGDFGNDVLNTGRGSDRVNARDGERDWIRCVNGVNDLVYYDRGLDVVRGCSFGRLVALSAPEEPFGPKSKILVDHRGEELCVPEAQLKEHLRHDDEIINPQGCSSAREGR